MSGEEQEATFRRWLDDHLGLMLKVVRTCAATPEDQEDLFQDVLLQLWSSVPAFRGEAKETTWIYRVALNTALAWQRQETKRRTRQTPLLAFKELPGTGDNAGQIEQEEIVARLYAAIQQLPRVDAALVLLYLDDLSYREMAEVLGISESNVGVKLNRARKALGELMKEAAYES